jgi:hypothetical protein
MTAPAAGAVFHSGKTLALTGEQWGIRRMDRKKLEALARKNAAKAAPTPGKKTFGKKYDPNRPDDPQDEATLEAMEANARFFAEMKKRDF